MNSLFHKTIVSFIVLLALLLGIAGCGGTTDEATPPAEPAAMEPVVAEVVLAEGETVCELTILDETSDAALEHPEPELGRVVRGHLIWADMNCPGSFDKARVIAVQDFWDFDPATGEAGVWIGYNEIIPETGGTWKGQCEVIEGVSHCILEGDGVNDGKRLETALDFENMTQTYRIFQEPQG
jgi:hypothetical protein